MNDPRWALRVRGEATAAIEIDIYDVIGSGPWGASETSASHVRATLREAKQAKAISVRINSVGGNVPDGLAIHSLLRDHPAKVTVHVDGLAGSIASVVAMAGDEIIMAESAFMMIHNPWGLVVGNASDMREHADLLDKFRDVIVDIYATRTGQKREDVVAAVDAETWMTASEALELGYATKVVPLKAKPERKAAAAAWNLTQFTRVPAAVLALIRPEATTPAAKERTIRMDPKIIAAALGLPEDTPEDQLEEAMKQAAAARDALTEATGKTSVPAALGAFAAWKTKVEIADAYEAKAKASEAAQKAAGLIATIDAAVDDGRLPPAKRVQVLANAEKFGAEWLDSHLELLEPRHVMRDGSGRKAPLASASATNGVGGPVTAELVAASKAAGMSVTEYQEWSAKADSYFAAQRERGAL